MIWLTFRQFRVQAAVVFGGLAILCAVLAVTGPGLADEYDEIVATCTTQDACSRYHRAFFNDHQTYFGALTAFVIFVPGVIGVFWGGPLITRELEAGTHRLVWNQSITRARWLAVKLGLVGLCAMVAAGLAVLAVDWWSTPVDKAAAEEFSRLTPLLFDARGITPIAHAAFAFALGVTVGVLVRRTLPAMAITLVVFAAVQIAMPLSVRPYLIPPERKTLAITDDNRGEMLLNEESLFVTVNTAPGAWTISNDTVDASGQKVNGIPRSQVAGACEAQPPQPGSVEPPKGPPQSCFDKLAQLGYKQKVVYQPAERFWPLQWAETGVFAVLTLGLAGFCFYWTRRRVS